MAGRLRVAPVKNRRVTGSPSELPTSAPRARPTQPNNVGDLADAEREQIVRQHRRERGRQDGDCGVEHVAHARHDNGNTDPARHEAERTSANPHGREPEAPEDLRDVESLRVQSNKRRGIHLRIAKGRQIRRSVREHERRHVINEIHELRMEKLNQPLHSDNPESCCRLSAQNHTASARWARCWPNDNANSRIAGRPSAAPSSNAASTANPETSESPNQRKQPAAASTASASALWKISQRCCTCCHARGLGCSQHGKADCLRETHSRRGQRSDNADGETGNPPFAPQRQFAGNLGAVESAQGGGDIRQ